ncbi:MAG: PKD domain-containing protein [Paludibacteraceae bacterium]|nr:PKD domain-containing protein [Paludibacteraceae bacterium]
MKKSLFFAGMLVIAGILATSCKPKVEAPKANFDYEVDGLDVTFTNLTKGDGTLTYAWEFGDGAQSTEAAPKHTYAAAGQYDVTLTATNEGGSNKRTNTISLSAPSIKIDGNFDDWGKVDFVEASVSSKAKYANLYNTKWTHDDDYIYFYCEFNAEQTGVDKDGNPLYVVEPVDMMLDLDNDASTGMLNYLWDKTVGTEWLIEIGSIYEENAFEGALLYQFTGATQDDWSWADTESAGFINGCAPVTLANNHKAFEAAILKAMIPGGVKGCRVGIFTSDSGWSESGVLPETILEDDGTSVASPLLKVF